LTNLVVGSERISVADTLEVRVEVTNQGAYAAEETVFLFVHDKVATVTRPLLELKGVGKVSLRPGETRTVSMLVPATDLQFLGPDLTPVFEPGEVEVLVGPCADRAQLLLHTIRLF
jgi:beta-glucosidase